MLPYGIKAWKLEDFDAIIQCMKQPLVDKEAAAAITLPAALNKKKKWSKHAPQTVKVYYHGICYAGSGQQDVEKAPEPQETENPRQAS